MSLSRVTPATIDVLQALVDGDGAVWGLRIVGETGRPAGSVYPILARLEEGGWVSSRWDEDERRGPRRRLYELTPDGRESASVLLASRTSTDRAANRARGEVGFA